MTNALSRSSIGPTGRGMLVSRKQSPPVTQIGAVSERGAGSTFCSHTADMLCTSADIFGEVPIASVDFAPVVVARRGHLADLHAPR
ncbi:hypothetical protein LTS63_06530 [Mycobacterium intracellulare]|uniref:hypothetical protein n=1 Tax=Mycobacterium intracellulare TaxID=1767 RepID=UPI001E476978|nr:hypothetical protein [Mycobacterium intracellulare]UGU03380.1 hypothetical protein LTS63_06530 [Mycobacterium intracellulare]